MRRLRLILGDQLNAQHSWFRERNPDTLYLLAELHQEATYVKHHIQKLVAFFAAMRTFAQALERAGHQVRYFDLDQSAEYPDLCALIDAQLVLEGCDSFEYQRPDEWRLLGQLRSYTPSSGATINEFDTEHFLLPYDEIPKQFKSGTAHRMESFYRKMRKRSGYLMNGGEPEGERWNFDTENRNKFKSDALAQIPEPLLFAFPTAEIKARIDRQGIDYFGTLDSVLIWPTSRAESLQLLDYFCQICLPNFGTYQDAMTDQSRFDWSLYHARLSFSLNSKMIHPAQVIERAINEYRARPEQISLAQIEGFVRQILGWREFIRGLYWANMPQYQTTNHLDAQRALPEFYWTGTTGMRCMQKAIGQSLEYAYAHHIQRLMVTGNFALIAGIEPAQVDQWYLGVYIDAIEWVELPNTRGMSQFADGGLVASKPYAASGQYINRMSDYCRSCRYKVNQKTEETSCPFNSLYWSFMVRHRARFESNPRIGMIYRNWDRQTKDQQDAVLARANWCLDHLDQL